MWFVARQVVCSLFVMRFLAEKELLDTMLMRAARLNQNGKVVGRKKTKQRAERSKNGESGDNFLVG